MAATPGVARRDIALDPGGRSLERLHAHYLVERELADRLRAASREERETLYGEVYDELFARVPDHPQLTATADPAARERRLAGQESIVRRVLPKDATFLEIGAGDCALTVRVAPHVRRAIAVEVSADIAVPVGAPANVELLLTDGRTFPVDDGSVDLAYSNQLLEHLHPDDAAEQVAGVLRTLAPGGAYVCLTPHPVVGPSDISAFFDDEATGFHLVEYSTADLVALFRRTGFGRVQVLARVAGRILLLPAAPFVLLERLAARLPDRLRLTRLTEKLVRPGGGVIAHRR